MAKSTPEGAVKTAVKKRLEHYGILPFTKLADSIENHHVGMYWMPVQGQFAVHGVHDFCGVLHGIFWSLETKAPDNKVDATGPQYAFQTASAKAGGVSLVGVRSADAVDFMVETIIRRVFPTGKD